MHSCIDFFLRITLCFQAPSSSAKKLLSQPSGQVDDALASDEAAAMDTQDEVDGNGSDNDDAGPEQDGER